MTTAVTQQNEFAPVANTPRGLIEMKKDVLLKALPERARERFYMAALGVASSPGIERCTPESVMKAIYQCARLNLIPDPVLHHAAVTAFRNNRDNTYEATLMIEYRGLIELMKRASPSLSIKAGTVYQGDDYQLLEGTEDKLIISKRSWEKDVERGKAILFYATAREPGAEPVLVVVSAQEAESIGKSSKAGMTPGTPWHQHFDRMGEKTAIRRLERFLRMDPDKPETKQFREAIEFDERTEAAPMGGAMESSDIFELASDVPPSPIEGSQRIHPRPPHDAAIGGTSEPPATVTPSAGSGAAAPPLAGPDEKKMLGVSVDNALTRAGKPPSEQDRHKLLRAAIGLRTIGGIQKRLDKMTVEQMESLVSKMDALDGDQVNQIIIRE